MSSLNLQLLGTHVHIIHVHCIAVYIQLQLPNGPQGSSINHSWLASHSIIVFAGLWIILSASVLFKVAT